MKTSSRLARLFGLPSAFHNLKSRIQNRGTRVSGASKIRSRRLLLETLENRSLLTGVDITIGDASAIEGSSALKLVDRFVQDGSGGLARPRGAIFGPDGNSDGLQDLYVPSVDTNQILRYDGKTGAFLDVFVSSGSGGLDSPADLKFGPTGGLYVSSFNSGEVLRYDGSTGAFIDVVASGLSQPSGLTFGQDNSLYITNTGTNDVVRYSASGLSVFVSSGSGGLSKARNAAFGPDGNGEGIADLYVNSVITNNVLRYNGATGAFLDVFATTPAGGTGPAWINFGADGYLYASARTTTSGSNTSIVRFNGTSDALIDSYALGRDGWSFNIGPDNLIYDSANGDGNFVERFGASSLAAFTVSLSAVSATPVTVNFDTANGTGVAGSDYTTTSGTITFAPGQTKQTILVKTLDDATYEGSETFVVNLSSAVGATIADGQGVGTILDNEQPPTKFYVVDDGSANKTFEYGASGAAIENYVVNSGNSAPRGAAATIAGDKVWVADANKNVYVYNTSGGLLGSWSAGSLPSNADVQGITTNGTDVWLVDAKGDKVYRFTGAASRTSGSQTAASSFSLNSSNSDATDLVTDGTSIWVVNNSSADKVFKYNVGGSLLGSWTITSGGGSPTGITIDPASVSNIWIVDSSTDRVYQFDTATSRTSGSQSPSTSFALSATNTNPQGIADPPPNVVPSLREGPATRVDAASGATASATNDDALLAVIGELDGLLGVKKRK